MYVFLLKCFSLKYLHIWVLSVLIVSYRFEVNFGQQAPWFPPAPGFLYIMQYPQHERVRGLKPPSSKSSCEVRVISSLMIHSYTCLCYRFFLACVNNCDQNSRPKCSVARSKTSFYLVVKTKFDGVYFKKVYGIFFQCVNCFAADDHDNRTARVWKNYMGHKQS